MNSKRYPFTILVVFAIVASGCASKPAANTSTIVQKTPSAVMTEAVVGASTSEAMNTDAPEDMMMETSTLEGAMMQQSTSDTMSGDSTPQAMTEQDAMIQAPNWFTAELTDVQTGVSFTINDFKGKVVLVETMAAWCSNCLKQQTQVKALHELIGSNDSLVSIGLDVDINEKADMLKEYTTGHGFDWKYAVASVDVAREIGNLYGDQFLNPPSTPMMIIDHQGVVHPLPFGIKSAEDLQKALQPYLDASM